jgi:predicted RNA-binding protein with PIN domain
MPYLVDGNNVMGQTPGWHRDKPNARRRLVERLARFARIRNARITVVFDGAPERGFPDESAFRGVRILYSNAGSDADSRIRQLVDSSPNKRGLTVVTSDRQLGFLVRSSGASVVRSGEFRRQMEEAEQSLQAAQDGEQFDVDDVNEWLRYFGAEADEEPD